MLIDLADAYYGLKKFASHGDILEGLQNCGVSEDDIAEALSESKYFLDEWLHDEDFSYEYFVRKYIEKQNLSIPQILDLLKNDHDFNEYTRREFFEYLEDENYYDEIDDIEIITDILSRSGIENTGLISRQNCIRSCEIRKDLKYFDSIPCDKLSENMVKNIGVLDPNLIDLNGLVYNVSSVLIKELIFRLCALIGVKPLGWGTLYAADEIKYNYNDYL